MPAAHHLIDTVTRIFVYPIRTIYRPEEKADHNLRAGSNHRAVRNDGVLWG